MTSSQRACAAPCAMPPCRWPSASSGLITAPASSTVTIRRSTALPVSVSTSSTAMYAPNGKVGPGALNTARTSSRSGSASLASGTEAAGSPATAKALRPASKTRSAGLASSVSAARCRATSISSCDACCTAALLQAARAAGAAALGDQVGIAPLHGDLVNGDAELVTGQHRPHGGVALPVRGGAGEDRRAAVGVDLDGGVLPRAALLHSRAGDLHVAGDADAELDHVAGRAPFGLLLAQIVVAGRRQRLVQRRRVVAAVVHGPERGRVRLGELRQQVLAADIGRVHADLGGEQVDGPLDRRGGLGPARAAVGADRG